ncbi:MAG TPA: polyprenyl diphosphate synthase [Anaerolineaceae bacterium]|nr:polyprenyl diphosphate synthase [Anaerolineaceae bacterium]HOT25793.1 polyprenyl diphosphate synthase [Anaerolineaceae bacterium]HQH58431.1 polyprenyl diphosphate synthase [Anaerolineaceae bacterium]HQK03734.1 polyprenyl diphosphate synthase [Anaerolineaceae bacterium]HQL27076.1 polyprenyl diphosphate synthase [Anaerolineaceae bacterium]
MDAAEVPLKIPTHVGLIMDGNGRWATARGLPRLAGHRAGVENLRGVITAGIKFGIKYLTFYAFSTENWNRPRDEVFGIMDLLAEFIDKETIPLHKEGVRILHIGHLDRLPPSLVDKINYAIDLTKKNRRITVQLAFNYGGRDEITAAVRKIVASGVKPENVTEALISRNLFTAGIPDPDLIIRTSGEMRTSNFLMWQSAYAEWVFPSTYWPDFNEDVFREMLREYSRRDRRFGGLSSK